MYLHTCMAQNRQSPTIPSHTVRSNRNTGFHNRIYFIMGRILIYLWFHEHYLIRFSLIRDKIISYETEVWMCDTIPSATNLSNEEALSLVLLLVLSCSKLFQQNRSLSSVKRAAQYSGPLQIITKTQNIYSLPGFSSVISDRSARARWSGGKPACSFQYSICFFIRSMSLLNSFLDALFCMSRGWYGPQSYRDEVQVRL